MDGIEYDVFKILVGGDWMFGWTGCCSIAASIEIDPFNPAASLVSLSFIPRPLSVRRDKAFVGVPSVVCEICDIARKSRSLRATS